MTQDCSLNDSSQYALILESPDSEEVFAHYCSEKPMDIGKRLVKLLHRTDIMQEGTEIKEMPSAAVMIINRAKELNAKGIQWHHYMLFPDCMFNNHKGKWTILFEDCTNKQTLESVTSNEPISELKEIETLFYKQQA